MFLSIGVFLNGQWFSIFRDVFSIFFDVFEWGLTNQLIGAKSYRVLKPRPPLGKTLSLFETKTLKNYQAEEVLVRFSSAAALESVSLETFVMA